MLFSPVVSITLPLPPIGSEGRRFPLKYKTSTKELKIFHRAFDRGIKIYIIKYDKKLDQINTYLIGVEFKVVDA